MGSKLTQFFEDLLALQREPLQQPVSLLTFLSSEVTEGHTQEMRVPAIACPVTHAQQ